MTLPLENQKIAFLSANGVEQIELEAPLTAVQQAGATGHIVSPTPGSIASVEGEDEADSFDVNEIAADVEFGDYAALVIPGGEVSVDALGRHSASKSVVREFMEHDKIVAVIGSACGLLIDTKTVKGRTISAPPELRGALEAAGGIFSDRPVSIDQNLITCGSPDELKEFCSALIEHLADSVSSDIVDEASEESFPASDAPAWSPSSIGARKGKKEGRANSD